MSHERFYRQFTTGFIATVTAAMLSTIIYAHLTSSWMNQYLGTSVSKLWQSNPAMCLMMAGIAAILIALCVLRWSSLLTLIGGFAMWFYFALTTVLEVASSAEIQPFVPFVALAATFVLFGILTSGVTKTSKAGAVILKDKPKNSMTLMPRPQSD